MRTRRRKGRRRLGILLSILALVILGALLWLLWQPYTRISGITVYGADQSYAHYGTDAMHGAYLGIIPRDSAFFYPAHQIRAAILADHPEIAAVSLFREGLTGLSIKIIPRVAVADWCGLAPLPTGDTPYCYVFDASGYIYSAASSSDQVLNPFTLYDALAASSIPTSEVGTPTASVGAEPLGATLASANEIPAAFDFARKLAALGGIVSSVVIRGDPPSPGYGGASEVDDYVASSTRITYVLGDEQAAYAALVSAKGDYNLSDGSLDYLDLRFPAKIYLKKN